MPNSKVHVGNWQEQQIYEADRRSLLKDARSAGATLSQQILAKVKHHKQAASLQPQSGDGFLRFGQPLMLQNAETDGFLSIDTQDRLPAGQHLKTVPTTAPADGPMLRNTFVLVPVPSQEDMLCASADPSIVHYGQRFLVQCLPEIDQREVVLASLPKSPSSQSKVTSNQEAFFSSLPSQQSYWTALHANREYREDMIGQPVKANGLAVLNHAMTNIPLGSTKARYGNDFGMEWEVCCNRFLTMQAKGGHANELPANLWALVTAPPAPPATPT